MADDTYRFKCGQCDTWFSTDELAVIFKRAAWHWNREHGRDLRHRYERIDTVERGGDRIHENIYQIERVPIYLTAFDMADRLGMEDGWLTIGDDDMVCVGCHRYLRADDERQLIEERSWGPDRWRCQDCADQREVEQKQAENEQLTAYGGDCA